MKSFIPALMVATLAAPGLASADALVKIYSGFSEAGGDISFSGLSNTYTSSSTLFGDVIGGRNGFPGASTVFGAEVTGFLQVNTAGTYSVVLGSDDASYLFINGAPTLSLPGDHGYFTQSTSVSLAAGLTPFRIAYQNTFCCGAALSFETAATVVAVPEPGTWALMGGGLALVGASVVARRRKQAA